jgi:tRNA-dihydrouridine synthase A
MSKPLSRRISIAPMLDWTNRHCRYFMRLMTKHTLLYTEMISTGAIKYGDTHRFLAFSEEEHPIALQLGGSNPSDLAYCAKKAEQYGYDELNLNVGCPSGRVQSGGWGACLMAKPALVADCVKAMQDATPIPVTVKTRIGIDDQDSYEALCHFISTVAATGCNTFIIHARKAWLQGLSPKENRNVPPLRYDVVRQLKKDFPHLEIILNGGIKTIEAIETHLTEFDGVMIGREAYRHPYLLSTFDELFFQAPARDLSRETIISDYLRYAEMQLTQGAPLQRLTKPLLGLFHQAPRGKYWRRYLSENVCKKGAGVEVVVDALGLCGASAKLEAAHPTKY